LRDVERRRLILTEYVSAEEVRRHADDVQSAETRAAREKAVTQWKVELGLLRERQRAEMEAADAFTREELMHLDQRNRGMVGPIENALKKAEREEREAGVRGKERSVSEREGSPGRGSSPRRTSGLTNQVWVAKLDLEGFDVQEYVNRQRAQTRIARSRMSGRGKVQQKEEGEQTC
jgi:hypothetical protein